MISSNDTSKSFSNRYEKKLVLKKPVQQNNSLSTVLWVLTFQRLRIQSNKHGITKNENWLKKKKWRRLRLNYGVDDWKKELIEWTVVINGVGDVGVEEA